jgi:hypothetical protein
VPVGGNYRIQFVRSPKPFSGDRKRVRIPKIKPPLKRAAFAALHATPRAEELTAQIPELTSLAAWTSIASYKVCGKNGTAAFLDIWDADHFDDFTDMPRRLTDCRAWFSSQGFACWGSDEGASGRINCYFRAPADGNYVCSAQSYPSTNLSTVERLIDDSSFGLLPFTGTVVQPPCGCPRASIISGYVRIPEASSFLTSQCIESNNKENRVWRYALP